MNETRVPRALLLANPKSGKGDAPLDGIVDRLSRGGLHVTRLDFDTPSRVSDIIIERREDADIVIVSGGDGTMNAAARGLMETGLPLGILPAGTANDLARTLDIPTKLEDAADMILRGHQRRIDLGEVNGHPFFNVASIGLSADLAEELTHEVKKRWGRLSYPVAALRAALTTRRFSATITSTTGTKRVKTLQIAVGNGRHYGGGNVVQADAEIDDGRLDLYSIEADAWWRLLLMARAFRAGAHGAWDEVRTEHDTWFDITTRRPRSINADGEIVSQTPAQFRIRRSAVAVFCGP